MLIKLESAVQHCPAQNKLNQPLPWLPFIHAGVVAQEGGQTVG